MRVTAGLAHRFLQPAGQPAILAAAAIALLSFLACGAEGGAAEDAARPEQTFRRVTPSDRLFSLDDLSPTGFKVAKEYDVDGLTAATGAWFGFWRPSGLPAKEYEIRFYASHADAVEHGTPFAEEATGADAVLDEDEATWPDGIKDRRYFFAGPIGTHGSGSVQAKYGGYAIYGNMVLLCEGADPVHSLERCAELVAALLSAE